MPRREEERGPLQPFRLEVRGIALDPAQPGAEAELEARLAIPRVAEEVRLTGRLRPSPLERGVDLDLDARGLTLEALRPYLAPRAAPALEDGALHLAAS